VADILPVISGVGVNTNQHGIDAISVCTHFDVWDRFRKFAADPLCNDLFSLKFLVRGTIAVRAIGVDAARRCRR
jgi:hypothetical protein